MGYLLAPLRVNMTQVNTNLSFCVDWLLAPPHDKIPPDSTGMVVSVRLTFVYATVR